MSHNPSDDLPNGWSRPIPINREFIQRTFFDRPTEELLAEMRISTTEMERWYRNEWLSFRASPAETLNEVQEAEIRFIASIARSGLSDPQINELLKELSPPYSFSLPIAYSFVHGWVTPTDAGEVVSANVDDWLTNLAEDGNTVRLSELADRIFDLLHQEDAEQDDEEEEGQDEEAEEDDESSES